VASVLRAFTERGMPVPVDWEHATDVRGSQGLDAPAAGWITRLESRDGALVGNVEWTPRAAEQIRNREYRYLSPVFAFEKSSRRIRALESVALTNVPNLRLTALNRRAQNLEDDAMLLKALCKLLGLPETATEEQVTQAVTKLNTDLASAKNRAVPAGLSEALGLPADADAPALLTKVGELAEQAKAANKPQPRTEPAELDLTRYVPRADYDQAQNRASAAETQLAEIRKQALDEEIGKAVNRAIAEGKIAPASKEFYVASCRREGGLEEFKKFAEAAPQVIKDPQLPATPGTGNGSGLSDAELAVCRNMGLDETEFAKSLKEEK
jgi:phage I-like protein